MFQTNVSCSIPQIFLQDVPGRASTRLCGFWFKLRMGSKHAVSRITRGWLWSPIQITVSSNQKKILFTIRRHVPCSKSWTSLKFSHQNIQKVLLLMHAQLSVWINRAKKQDREKAAPGVWLCCRLVSHAEPDTVVPAWFKSVVSQRIPSDFAVFELYSCFCDVLEFWCNELRGTALLVVWLSPAPHWWPKTKLKTTKDVDLKSQHKSFHTLLRPKAPKTFKLLWKFNSVSNVRLCKLAAKVQSTEQELSCSHRQLEKQKEWFVVIWIFCTHLIKTTRDSARKITIATKNENLSWWKKNRE